MNVLVREQLSKVSAAVGALTRGGAMIQEIQIGAFNTALIRLMRPPPSWLRGNLVIEKLDDGTVRRRTIAHLAGCTIEWRMS